MAPRFLILPAWCRFTWGRLILPLWPPACRLCGRRGRGPWCDRCDDVIPLYPRRCAQCANPRLDAYGTCRECRRRPPRFESVTALGAYRRDLRLAIHRLKFAGGWDLAFPIGERLAETDFPAVDVLVPIPLHPARERERGYNQAMLIAQALGGARGIRCRPALRRTRPTAPQICLDRDSRTANVTDAFAVDSTVAGLRVGLVDDVFTSGATAQAAALVLRAAGARQIQVIVAARAIPAPWARP